MDYATNVAKFKELLDKAKDVLVVTHEHPTYDSMGSALSLYLGLVSLGKKVTVACPDPITVELSSFVGVNKVISDFNKNNFVISLDYVEGSIEKVSYNIEGKKFNLVVEHRPGFEPFSEDKVHYSHANITADLIIAVDTIHLGGLKKLYENEKTLFTSKPIVSIDRHLNSAMFGQLNMVDTQAVTTAEVVAQVLSGLGVKLTVDIATNLLNGLSGGTNNFQSPTTTAQVLEIAAVCMRAGGKRFTSQAQDQSVTVQEEIPSGEKVVESAAVTGEHAVHQTGDMPAKGQESTVHADSASHATTNGHATQPPADWLKPKIFKSSSLL